ncbi:MAG: septum formation initiator family protein [Oscillospiraceae bacterium]|nr:septum formation initiator family protein [Oscillospiraceae bacterium]
MKVKRAGIGTKLLVLVLLVAAVLALLSMRTRLTAVQAQQTKLQEQVLAQTEKNSALADAIAHSDNPEYIANIARSKLGLLEPGEIRFVDTAN